MAVRSIRDIPELYHFTDVRNLPSIKRVGGLLSWYELKKKGLRPIAPGGNQVSHDEDVRRGMDRYVHLCFLSEHPMEYVARKDGRIEKSLFLKIDPQVLHIDGVKFTLDVANKSGVEAMGLAEADQKIDFEILYSSMDWRDPAIMERRNRSKKYEILIPDVVSLSLIRNMPDG
jgi:hypothetical protein